jgi:aldose sugar dehydrogenase
MINKNRTFIILSLSLFFPLLLFTFCNVYAQQVHQPLAAENITLHDPNLKIELVASRLDFPTTMAFLAPDDFLILEKTLEM